MADADRPNREELIVAEADERRQREIERFMQEQDPLDAAELYRLLVGRDRYQDFLRSQFETRPEDADALTPSHEALVRLPVRELFTTNYDDLIELAYQRGGVPLAVSTSPEEFLQTQVGRPERHLIKLHGTWQAPDGLVLTRDDYARSRTERSEMFRHFGQETRFSAFLFVGFSLTDPNFNLIRDEARAVMGAAMPTSYLVQEHVSGVTRDYLSSLDVETIELFSWNELPRFLHAINPS